MVQKVSVLLLDDIDGSEADETIQFGLEGVHYEIDLNREHAKELRGELARYVKEARKVKRSVADPNRVHKTASSGRNNKEIRAWARQRGLDINGRGRIPGDIIAQYEVENSK